jgi:hypothetical protein
MSQFKEFVNEVFGDWPYDERSNQHQAEQEKDRRQMQQEIEGAWERLMKDTFHYKQYYSTESDIKLLKRALGVK